MGHRCIFSQDDTNKILLGECKWPQAPLSQKKLDALVKQLIAKSIPSFLKKNSLEITYVICVPEKPRNLKAIKNVLVVDARSVIDTIV